MNEEMFGQFLLYAMILCVVMGVLTPIMRWKKFGKAALPLGGAFLVMAVLLFGLSSSWQMGGIVGVAFVLVVLLATDALLRAGSGSKP